MRFIDPYRFPSNTVLGRLIRLPLRVVPRNMNVPIVRGPNRGMKWRTGSAAHGCWLGTFEHQKVDVFCRQVRPGMVAYDIGANVGFYTLLLSRRVGPSGRVVAFEPLPDNLVHLRHHLELNEVLNCEIVSAAVADSTGVASLSGAESGASICAGNALLQVPTVALDDLIERLGRPAPDVVKMDVEGAEALVLEGARRLLARRSSVWFIALHGEARARQCARILLECGYRVRDLDGVEVSEDAIACLDEVYATP